MPTTTNITTTYAGEKAMPYLQAALLAPTTIRNGGLKEGCDERLN